VSCRVVPWQRGRAGMRMPNPIVQLRPPAMTLERVRRAQKFSTMISTASPRSGGRTTEKRRAKISWRGRLMLLFPCYARRARTALADILQFRPETHARRLRVPATAQGAGSSSSSTSTRRRRLGHCKDKQNNKWLKRQHLGRSFRLAEGHHFVHFAQPYQSRAPL
jgi:hypothetical protein